MSDYSQGKIYILTSEQTPEIYIGSTKLTLEERLDTHNSSYISWLRTNKNYCTSFEICKYDDCKIHLIENYPCETRKELELKEGEYQRMMDCVNKYIAGRSRKEWYEKNKEHIQEYLKEYYSRPEIKEKQKEYYSRPEIKEKQKKYYSKPEIKEKQKRYYKEYKSRKGLKIKIKCICGKEIRKDNIRRHEKGKNHIKYIEEMKEKADSTNLNEFFEQFKFKLTTN